MADQNTFVGLGLLWGFPNTTTTGTVQGFGDVSKIQSMDFNRKAQKDQAKDGRGNTCAVCYSDHEDNFNFDFLVTSGTNTGGITVGSMPTVGATLAFTDSNFAPLTATFLLDDISCSRGNTKAMLAKLTLSRYLSNSLP